MGLAASLNYKNHRLLSICQFKFVKMLYNFIIVQCLNRILMYQINTCSPIWDHTPTSAFNAKLIRILLLVVLMLLFLLYVVIHFLLKKTVQNLKADDSGQRLYQKQSFMQKWQREYLMMLGDHTVAVGFVICYSPYQFQVMLSILYFGLRCAYEVLLHKYGRVQRALKTLMRIINLSLLVCSMIGLSRTGLDPSLQVCRDTDYRSL